MGVMARIPLQNKSLLILKKKFYQEIRKFVLDKIPSRNKRERSKRKFLIAIYAKCSWIPFSKQEIAEIWVRVKSSGFLGDY